MFTTEVTEEGLKLGKRTGSMKAIIFSFAKAMAGMGVLLTG